MANFTKFTSGFTVGTENIGIEAAKVQWPAISALTAASGSSATSGIMTPDQIQSLVATNVASVYKVKGSATRETLAAKADTSNVVGDVYNVTDAGELPIKKDSETKITLQAGDNIVWTTDGWDKLASSVSLEGYATQEWVNSGYSAASAAIANAVTAATDMSAADNANKIAQVGAITGYTEKYVTSAFGTVVVTDKTGEGAETKTYDASAKNDKIKFVGGTNVSLATTTDANGNPTITINNTYEAEDAPTITGGNGVTAAYVAATEGVAAHYEVSGVDATPSTAENATKGVTYAAYYDNDTGLIHLF